MSVEQAEEMRTHVHTMWAAVAEQWGIHADDVDQRGVEVTERMLAGVSLHAGETVLELACGPGGAGISAAHRVGPTGHVVLSDVVKEMAEIAGTRAATCGLSNVSTATIDIEAIDADDNAYDVVLCREGLMFAVEPQRAVDEIARVLRPGGRVAVAVWGPQQDNPWLGIVFESVSAVTGFPVPPPGVPGPFSLGDENRLHMLLTSTGFTDVSIEPVDVPLRSPSFEAWWSRVRAIAGPLSAMLARLDAATLAAIEERLRASVEQYSAPDGIELPGVALVATARR